jgi:hypothetical protein
LIGDYEASVLLHILQPYYVYMMRQRTSLLPWLLGLYKVTLRHPKSSQCHVLVMRNVFDSSLPLHERYDLKGSTVARQATQDERQGPGAGTEHAHLP